MMARACGRVWMVSAVVVCGLLAARGALGQPRIVNGSFEADGTTINDVGYVGFGTAMTGWAASNPIGAARNTAGMAFFDNGVVPDGRCVAVLQNLNSISQSVRGFRPGRVYRLTLRANGRASDAPECGGLRAELNGTVVLDVPRVPPVGGRNPYHTYSGLFRAGTASCVLTLRQTNPAPGVSVLLDDVRVESASAGPGQAVAQLNLAAVLDGAVVGGEEDLTDRDWIWTDESPEPGIRAPAGRRWFRRVVVLPQAPARATVVMSADNTGRLIVNGRPAGWSDDFHRLFEMDVTALLHQGANVLSVEAENAGPDANPAGVIAMLSVRFAGRRRPLVVATDSTWRWAAAPAPGWDTPGYRGGRPVRTAATMGGAPWGWLGPVSRRVPRGFVDFRVPGQEKTMAAIRKLLQVHLPGARPMATLWDGWLAMSGLWPSPGSGAEAVSLARTWREALLGRRISPEGYVATMQHRGFGHSEGWPIPLYMQTGGVGFHFSLANDVLASWVARLTKPNEWSVRDLTPQGVDKERGWLLSVAGASPTATTPRFDIPMAAAPFVRVEWQMSDVGPVRAYVQWATADRPEFDEARRCWFAPPSPGAGMTYADVPIHLSPAWRPEGRMVALRVGLEGAGGGRVALKSVITPADTRHNVNNPAYLQGCADYVAWTGDVDFLRRDIGRMRLAMRYAIDEFRLRQSHCVDMPWYGHDGRSGFERTPDGKRIERYAVGVANNYWDLLPFGGKDALATIYCFDALRRMATLERSIEAHPEWQVPGGADRLAPAELEALAAAIKADAGRRFWNPTTGRFVASIDGEGAAHDYGYTFVNCEAIHYGFAAPEQARTILDWLDGKRVVAGDTSTGPDIYRWRFAPRASTLRNTTWYSPMWEPLNVKWGDQVQDGGAVLGFSYHDLMARLRTHGPDDAWRRLRAIARWFEDVQSAGGYRRYYAVPGRGTMQGGGPPGGLGMDEEFFESALLPQVILYGFLGFRPGVDAFSVEPSLPASWPSLTVTRIRYHGLVLDVAADRRSLRVTVRGGAAEGPVRLLAPAGRWAATVTQSGAGTRTARPAAGAYSVPTRAGSALVLRRT